MPLKLPLPVTKKGDSEETPHTVLDYKEFPNGLQYLVANDETGEMKWVSHQEFIRDYLFQAEFYEP